MEVFDSELWPIRIAQQNPVARADALGARLVTTLAVFSDPQAAIRRTMHLDPGPGQQLGRAVNKHSRALNTNEINVMIHCVPGHSDIPGNEEADRHANKA
jgi:ribonuclease HI